MKSLLLLWKVACADAYADCCTGTTLHLTRDPEAEMAMDFEYVQRRYEEEGLSFLTITLPTFGKALERCLEKGSVTRQDFPKFKRASKKSVLPAFLQGLLGLLFDRKTGRLIDYSSDQFWGTWYPGQAAAVQAIRQLTLMFAKIRLDCTPDRDAAAVRRYVDCEREVKRWDREEFPHLDSEFSRVFRLLFGPILDDLNKVIYEGDLIPHHGPGSTADKLHGNKKWSQKEWPNRLEQLFPFGDNVLPNWRHYHVVQDVNFLEPGAERPVKVVLVPKTLETPRVIAVEPTCMQYMQQAIASKLVPWLEGATHGMLGFTDQDVSRRLARSGSQPHSGHLATVDLKDASDRVSNELVRHLFARWSWVSQAIDATRSRTALLPNGRKIRLAKFASMGSALCFPVEAMVFLTAALVGVQRSLNRSLTFKDLRDLGGTVRVYGDDIIVPIEHVQCVVETLESIGLKVNSNKTFWKGSFRESCGGEYFASYDVGYVKLRELLPSNRTDAKGIISLIAFRNLLFERGYWKAARFCDEQLEALKVPMPIVEDDSPISGRKSFLPYKEERTHPTLHKPLVRGVVESSRVPANRAGEWGALTKCLVLPFQEDEEHLERSGRPDTVGIKIRWETPY